MNWLTNLLQNPQVSGHELTTFINTKKYVPRLLSLLLKPREKGTFSDAIWVEKRAKGLALIPFAPRGGEATHLTADKRSLTLLKIPHIPIDTRIHVDEFMGVRKPGEMMLWLIREIIDDRMESFTDRFAATEEYHLLQMLKGMVSDVDGTAWHNIFTELGVSAATEVGLDLTAASPAEGAVTRKVMGAKRAGRDGLDDMEAMKWGAICGQNLWDDFCANKEVRDSWRFDSSAQQLFRDDLVDGAIGWRGVMWMEYSRTVGGNSLLHPDKGILFPLDAPIYERQFAPADYLPEDLESENRGLAMYVPPPTVDPENPNSPKYIRLDAQTNPITWCTRPGALVPLRRGA